MSSDLHDISLTVNGEAVREAVEPRRSLVDFLQRGSRADRQPCGLR